MTDRKLRAELTDESLAIITGLWKGAPFRFQGKHYQLDVPLEPVGPACPPAPVQKPRIPIWVVGVWKKEKSMHRALRYDGLLPALMGSDGRVRMQPATPQEIFEIRKFIDHQPVPPDGYDIVVEGITPGDDPARATEIVREYSEAGATWWIEALWSADENDQFIQRLLQGPPTI